MIKEVEILVIGGGPAGLCAAAAAASMGAEVLLCERDGAPGGQLVKQTHKFFGSERQYAGERGFQIGKRLTEQVKMIPASSCGRMRRSWASMRTGSPRSITKTVIRRCVRVRLSSPPAQLKSFWRFRETIFRAFTGRVPCRR